MDLFGVHRTTTLFGLFRSRFQLLLCILSNIFLLVYCVNFVSSENNFYSKPSKYPSHNRPSHCYSHVSRCTPLNTSLCLDVTLPYKHTSLEYFSTINELDQESFAVDIHHYLSQWKGLRAIPQCWKALQSVLCASFFPRCDNESSRVMLPTQEMCRLTRGPCRLIGHHYKWPEFLRCDNKTLFPSKCQNEYTDLKFTNLAIANRCSPPLVSTDDRKIWYPGIDGCALRCHNPLYTDEQHSLISKYIAYGSVISLVFTSFAVFTFIIDRKSFNRYPSVIIFYLNFCLMLSTLGWTLQFFKGRNEIVCRADNTTRYSEPSKPDNFYCTFSFLLIYYFSLTALIWFVQLSYVYDFLYKNTDSNRGALHAKNAYFHMSAWSIPLILTIFILLIGEIDGDSLRGICFVGFVNPVVRIVFVFVPLTGGVIIGLLYMSKSVLLLIKVKHINDKAGTANGEKKSKKIRLMIIRIALFSICILMSLVISFSSYIYELNTIEVHRKTLDDFIICNLNISTILPPKSHNDTSIFSGEQQTDSLDVTSCKSHEPPSLVSIYLQLAAIFGTSLIASSWVWTSNTLASWKRFLNRCFNGQEYINRAVRMKPYEVISKGYNRREQINQGTYMPSFTSNHNDPVDMDLNSALSQSLSNNFRENFNALLERRFAVSGNDVFLYHRKNQQLAANTATAATASFSQNLSVSDVSQQQLSFDSQLSTEQIELAAIVRNQRRKTKKERERFRQLHSRLLRRRGSDTSGSLISAAYITSNKFAPNGAVGKDFGKKLSSLETKSTSTGDLMNMIFPNVVKTPVNPATLNNLNPYMMAPNMLPFMAPPQPSAMMPPLVPPMPPTANFHPLQQTAPFMPPPAPTRMARVAKPNFSESFTFTHGMSDQSSHTLINPLLEKRRPDSRVSSNGPNGSVVGSSNLAVVNSSQSYGAMANPNFALNTMAANQLAAATNQPNQYAFAAHNSIMYPYGGPQQQQPFGHPHHQFSHLLSNGTVASGGSASSFGATGCGGGVPTNTATQYQAPLPGSHYFNPYATFLAQQQQQHQATPNLLELQALAREREAYLQLITPMMSDSEAGEFFPIQISDSEGMYSDSHLSRNDQYPGHSLADTKKLVEDRIQQVEDQVQQEEKKNKKTKNI